LRIKIQYFASLRELVGIHMEEMSLEEGSGIEDLMRKIKERHRPLMEAKRILVAVNGEYVDANGSLREGDLVSLFPPVSGG